MYYQKPKLNNGILSAEDALAIYKHYLTTDRVDYDGVKRRPTRMSTFHAMLKAHTQQSSSLIQTYIDSGRKVYFWSDQHFGHANIIKYSNRPFDDKSHMDKVMVKNYFDTVGDEDLVVWVGDVAFSAVEECRGLLSNLPGQKILIVGNHDFDRKENFKKYQIFSEIFMATSFQMKFEKNICNLLVSHYPVDEHLLTPNTLNIHGHIHTHDADFKNINVSVEKTNYAPIDITGIIKEKFEQIRE